MDFNAKWGERPEAVDNMSDKDKATYWYHIGVVDELRKPEAEASSLSDGLYAERKAKAFDFIQEHATRIHFDEACDSLIYSDKDHFTKDDWLLRAIEKANT